MLSAKQLLWIRKAGRFASQNADRAFVGTVNAGLKGARKTDTFLRNATPGQRQVMGGMILGGAAYPIQQLFSRKKKPKAYLI